MKILKYIVLTILGIVVLALILAAFLPKKFDTARSITINKPVNEVYDYIKFLKNQEQYGEWFKMDENIETSYSGTDGTTGFTISWKSKKVGNGRQVITGLSENQKIETNLFFENSEEPATSYISLHNTSPTATDVTWGVAGEMPYPFNLMQLFYDMGNDFEKGLVNLKGILEN